MVPYDELNEEERAEMKRLGIGIADISRDCARFRLSVYDVKSRKTLATMVYLGTPDGADAAVRGLAGFIARNRLQAAAEA